MCRRFSGLLVLSILAAPPPVRGQDGTLQRVREEVNGEDKSDKSERRNRPSESCDDERPAFGTLFTAILAAPFYLPYESLGDDLRVGGAFLPHPYAWDHPGYVWLRDKAEAPGGLTNLVGRFSLDGSSDFHGLNRVNGRLLFDTCMRFGVETGWTYLHERPGGGRTDEMVLGDVNLLFRFAQSDRAQFRTGVGTRILVDGDDTRFGFNFTYAADFFPAKPFVLSSVIDLGTLSSAGVFHGRLTGGVTRSGWEVFAGYDYLRVGRVDLQGPVVGVRVWF